MQLLLRLGEPLLQGRDHLHRHVHLPAQGALPPLHLLLLLGELHEGRPHLQQLRRFLSQLFGKLVDPLLDRLVHGLHHPVELLPDVRLERGLGVGGGQDGRGEPRAGRAGGRIAGEAADGPPLGLQRPPALGAAARGVAEAGAGRVPRGAARAAGLRRRGRARTLPRGRRAAFGRDAPLLVAVAVLQVRPQRRQAPESAALAAARAAEREAEAGIAERVLPGEAALLRGVLLHPWPAPGDRKRPRARSELAKLSGSRLGAAPPPVGPGGRGRGAPAPPARPCGAAAGPGPVPAARWPPRPRSAGSPPEPGPPPGAVCGRAVNQPSAAARTRGRPPRGGEGRRGAGGDCGVRARRAGAAGLPRAAVAGRRQDPCAPCDCAWPCRLASDLGSVARKTVPVKVPSLTLGARGSGRWWFSHSKKEGLPGRTAPQSVNMGLCC